VNIRKQVKTTVPGLINEPGLNILRPRQSMPAPVQSVVVKKTDVRNVVKSNVPGLVASPAVAAPKKATPPPPAPKVISTVKRPR
jgi:hypothetical protein